MPIRSFILALLLFALTQNNLFSQGFNGGISVGLAATQVDGDGHGGFDKAGPIVGVWTSRKFSRNISGSLEVRYIQKGSYAKNQLDGITVGYYRMRLHYTELPITVIYNLNDKINFSGGIGVAYLWKATEEDVYGPFPEEDIAQFRNYEVSGRIGIDYLLTSKLSVCLNFSYSVLPIRPHSGNISYRLDTGQFNNVMEITLRYQLGN
jgi:hypothetical protein